MTTSRAKNTPAIGALKLAATAAATPQPRSVRDCERVRRKGRPNQLAMAAPKCTAGPSRPVEAPDPIDAALIRAVLMP